MSLPSHLKSFIRSNRTHLRFLGLFFLFFILGQALNYVFFPLTDPLQFNVLNAEVSAEIINFVHPAENASAEGKLIQSGNFAVEVGWGCEATDGMITLGAGVLALSISLLSKLAGLLIGSVVIYFANLVRIVSLYFILKYNPQLFDLVHIYVGQIFLITIAVAFFIFWAKACHAVISDSPSEERA